jgi:ABC-type molybdate transport system substrate-binding protein
VEVACDCTGHGFITGTATRDIIVSAAASLTNAFAELARNTKSQPRSEIHFNFASSGALQQIARRAG